ncbi:dihydrofolate reductase [Crocinitomicaceae bacterium]|nr:dihydrofolate reductase [Crocinitomicaceae bacterium]
MKATIIVAMDLERGIGKNNDLMWNLPNDMKFFKETTQNQIVVMGRKNFDSIPDRFRPLPNRENIVLTRNTDFSAEGCKVFYSVNECLEYLKNVSEKKVFIIGGGEIYKLALESGIVHEMYITHVNHTYGADTFFPEFDLKSWNLETLHTQEVNDTHAASFSTLKYSKR